MFVCSKVVFFTMKDTVEKESDADMESAKKQINVDILKMQNDGIQVLKIDRRGRLRHIQLKLVNGGRSISWASKFLGSKLGSRNKGILNISFRLLLSSTTQRNYKIIIIIS